MPVVGTVGSAILTRLDELHAKFDELQKSVRGGQSDAVLPFSI